MSESITVTIEPVDATTASLPTDALEGHTASACTNDNAAPEAWPASPVSAAQSSAAPATKPAPKKLYKNVDQIIAATAHRVMGDIVLFEQDTAKRVPLDTLAEPLARKLLCEISHDAAPSTVLFALAAVGGPASVDEVVQRLQNAREAGVLG